MPAKLLITAGPLEGSELWIEYDVVRLGADDDCELQLVGADLPPHVVTLRYADGKFLVYNRTPEPLRLESKLVEPNASDVWRHGKSLHLPGGTTVRLETSGDGAPAPRAVAAALPTLAAEAEVLDVAPTAAGNVSAADAPRKKTGQTVMVALLFAAALGVLLIEEPTTDGPQTPVKSFAELTTALRNEKSLSPDLWIRFNEAYAAAYRGRAEEADVAFRRLRDRIDWERSLLSQAGREVPATLAEADDFVKRRLAGLP